MTLGLNGTRLRDNTDPSRIPAINSSAPCLTVVVVGARIVPFLMSVWAWARHAFASVNARGPLKVLRSFLCSRLEYTSARQLGLQLHWPPVLTLAHPLEWRASSPSFDSY